MGYGCTVDRVYWKGNLAEAAVCQGDSEVLPESPDQLIEETLRVFTEVVTIAVFLF